MERIKILRLITWLPAGGIERKISAVLPRMNRDLFEPHVCCIRERGPLADEIEAAGVPVHVIPFRGRWDPLALHRLDRLIQAQQFDIVHAHMYRANVPATAIKLRRKRLAVLGHYHNVDTWETRAQLMMDRWLSRRRDLNLAVSEAVRQDVIQRLKLDPVCVRTVHNGVDTDEFRPLSPSERADTRSRLGIPEGTTVVIMAARLVAQKNHALFLRAIPGVLGVSPQTHFILAGGGPDEPSLRQMARDLSIDQAVQFLGHRDDIAMVMGAADVSVLPSLREGFSNTILESMACGLPVIASNVGGNREVIDRGINGYILEVEQSADDYRTARVRETQFARCLKRLVVDAELRARMGRAARSTALGFGLDVMVRDTQDVYLETLERVNRKSRKENC